MKININNHDFDSLLNLNHNISTLKKLHFIVLTIIFIILVKYVSFLAKLMIIQYFKEISFKNINKQGL